MQFEDLNDFLDREASVSASGQRADSQPASQAGGLSQKNSKVVVCSWMKGKIRHSLDFLIVCDPFNQQMINVDDARRMSGQLIE